MVVAVDAAFVLLLCAFAVAEIAVAVTGSGRLVRAAAFGAAMTLPLLGRHRAPLAAALAVVAVSWLNAAVNGLAAGAAAAWLAYLVAMYAVGAHRDDRRAVLGGVVVLVPAVVAGAAKMRDGEDASALLSPVAVLLAAWVVGRVADRRRRRAADVRRREAELAERAAVIEREAAARERARIARELHDVVTHGMSVVVVQSQAAQALAGADTDGARRAMRAAEEAGRQALGEMRHLLGVIRHDDNADRSPQPGLADVGGLVERVRQAGLPVVYDTDADPASVPAGMAVTVYRIVQEALTNVVKHAGAVPTRVGVRVADAALEVRVANAAPAGPPPSGGGTGAGLAGMRERVAVYGGRLETGSSPDGGFAVLAVLPLPS